MPPLFISLDGLDGTGKSTQCRLLAAWLRELGREVTECADPGGTTIGDEIREMLLHRRHAMTPACEAFLFMASRSQLASEVIIPALGAGRIVVSDRYLLANVVYQGHAGGLDVEQLWQMGELATSGATPTITFILDLSVEEAARRRQGPADRVESRDLAYHTRVREGFLKEAARNPDGIKVINAAQAVQFVQQQIREEVARVLAAGSGT
jgi:dTMP kinase